MLQIDRAKSVAGSVATPIEVASPQQLYASFVSFVNRQYPLILFVLSLTVALGAAYLFTASPMYTGRTAMLIDTRKVQVFQQQAVMGDLAIDAAMVESQVEIMKSENIALSVIKDLHLTEDPEFVGPGGGLVGSAFHLLFGMFASPEPQSEFVQLRHALAVFQGRLAVRRIG